jgi:hypothetical protein
MVNGPGKYLIVMIWWILAFFLMNLCSHPLWAYTSSYVVYFIAFVVTLGSAVFLNVLESRFKLWSHRGLWGRFVILATAYTIVGVVSLAVTFVLDSYRLLAYFGGDAEGCFALLYIPSIVLYWLVGTVVCGVCSIAKMVRDADKRG